MKVRILVLLAMVMVAGSLSAITPAGADTTTTQSTATTTTTTTTYGTSSSLTTAGAKVIYGQPLTDVDKYIIAVSAMKMTPAITADQLNAVFAEYANGNTAPISSLAVSATDVTEAPKQLLGTKVLSNAGVATTDTANSNVRQCATQKMWIKVRRSATNIWGATLLSFTQVSTFYSDCWSILWTSPAPGRYIGISGTASIGGWQFAGWWSQQDFYAPYRGIGFDGNWMPVNPYGSRIQQAQAGFTQCIIRVGCIGTWNPWIKIKGLADWSYVDAWWASDAVPGGAYLRGIEVPA